MNYAETTSKIKICLVFKYIIIIIHYNITKIYLKGYNCIFKFIYLINKGKKT